MKKIVVLGSTNTDMVIARKGAKIELLRLPGVTTNGSVLWGHLSLTANNGSF